MRWISTLPPPLVGVLGFTFILGRAGTVNVIAAPALAAHHAVAQLHEFGVTLSRDHEERGRTGDDEEPR
jgi:ABC-type Fe3+ transport system permease subunit